MRCNGYDFDETTKSTQDGLVWTIDMDLLSRHTAVGK